MDRVPAGDLPAFQGGTSERDHGFRNAAICLEGLAHAAAGVEQEVKQCPAQGQAGVLGERPRLVLFLERPNAVPTTLLGKELDLPGERG